MKQAKLVLLLLALIIGGGSMSAQLVDVTATYLKNADFLQGPVVSVGHIWGYKGDFENAEKGNNTGGYWLQGVSGWSVQQSNADGVGGAVFAYGTADDHQLKGNNVGAPATGPDNGEGNALGFFAVWGNGAYYYQNVILPGGNYEITYCVYSQSGTTAPAESYFGFIPDNGTPQVVAPAQLTTTGQWLTLTATFTLSDITKGKIAVGYKSAGSGSAANPMLFIDNVTIKSDAQGDYTTYIKNPSFEDDGKATATPAGWTVTGGASGQVGTGSTTGGWRATGSDGNWLFNIWGGTADHEVSQTIEGLPAGHYVLTAMIGGWGDRSNWNEKNVTLYAGTSGNIQNLNTISINGAGVLDMWKVHFDVATANDPVQIGVLASKDCFFKADDFHLFKVDDENNVKPYEFDDSDWKVSGSTVTLNTTQHYTFDPATRYIVLKASGISTGIGDNKLTMLNGVNANGDGLYGNHYPTYSYKMGNDAYLVWDLQLSPNSVWGLLGGNVEVKKASGQVQLNCEDGVKTTAFTLGGTPSNLSVNFYATLPNEVKTAEEYTLLTELIDAAKELNVKLNSESNITAAIAAAETAAANTSSDSYSAARNSLLAGIQAGLVNGATEVDVTDVYIKNPSFETGWPCPYWANYSANTDGTKVDQIDLWGRDGNYIFVQKAAGEIVYNLADLAVGSYVLSAAVSCEGGQSITLKAGTQTATHTQNAADADYEGEVIETGEMTLTSVGGFQIGVSTTGSWFRVDNFRLTYKPSSSSNDVDKTQLHRMILTAQNLVELGEGNGDTSLDDLSSYISVANSSSSSQASVDGAISGLQEKIKAYYEAHNAGSQGSRPQASAPGNGNYYLYNVATKSYVTVGSRWGTRAIANDYRGEAGILFGLEGDDDHGYAMSTSQIWGGDEKWLFASTSNAVNIDGWTEVHTWKKLDEDGTWVSAKNDWAKMPWLFEEVPGLEGEKVYRLYRTSGDERDYGLPAGSRLKYVMSLDRNDIMLTAIDADGVLNELYSYWILVSEADRLKVLDAASLNSPVNASFLIKNPDLEGQNAQAEGTADNNYQTNGSPAMLPKTWTLTSASQVGNANGSDIIGDRNVESYDTESFDVYQTITLPKAGLYRLRVNGFYRPGGKDNHETVSSNAPNPQSIHAADLQHKGLVTMNPVLYAGGQQVPLMSINTGDKGTVLPFGLATDDSPASGTFLKNASFYSYGVGYYDYGHVPDDPAAGVYRFREDNGEGRYSDNSLLVYASTDNTSLKIGVKKTAKMANDWTLFDHFNLWYLGADGSEELAKRYNDYRTARIDAINVLFDTYHYTELRDTAYTKHLNANGFDLTTKYGSPTNVKGEVDVWTDGDPKGILVFAKWLYYNLLRDDAAFENILYSDADASEKESKLQVLIDSLTYDVAVADLAYNMAEFYFFSRGVQTFYDAVQYDGAVYNGAGDKNAFLKNQKVIGEGNDYARLEQIDKKVINTLRNAMGLDIPSAEEKFVLTSIDDVHQLNDSIRTAYPDLSAVKLDVVEQRATNMVKDDIISRARIVAQMMEPSESMEFDLTFLLPRSDLIGLEQWDWLPIYEWLSKDESDYWKYNYDVHTGNNMYQGHTAFFAEKYRPDDVGIDPNIWSIYQSTDLPTGLYRFSAAAFARHGDEKSNVAASNGYIAINLASASEETVISDAEKLYNVELMDHSAFYQVKEADVDETTNLATLNMGMFVGPKDGDFASWIGMSQMRLYKIPQVYISEDRVYRVGQSADLASSEYKTAEEVNDTEKYPYIFNFSEAAQIVGVRRSFSTGKWLSLTFPFDMTKQEFCAMLGIDNVIVNQFKGSKVNLYGYPDDYNYDPANPEYGARIDLYFERETGDYEDYIHAHVPCVVYIPEGQTIQPYNVMLDTDPASPTNGQYLYYDPGAVKIVKQSNPATTNPDGGDFSFDACYAGVHVGGTYVNGVLEDGNDPAGEYLPEESYFFSGGKLQYVPRKADYQKLFGASAVYKPVKSKGLRAYFTYHGDSQEVQSGNVKMMSFDFETENGTDKIELNNFGQVVGRRVNGRDVTGVYNMSGQLLRKDGSSLEGLSKGVYIVNGNKVIIK